MSLQEMKDNWVDEPQYHQLIHESFILLVNGTWGLNDHRTYVESNIFGMGERSFWWLWKMLLEELPSNPKLIEVGVFKGATLSLWKMLREDAQVFGVTPLDGRGTGWTDDDYLAHITKIHKDFGLDMPTLFVGGSEESEIIKSAVKKQPYDVVYIDGDHSTEGALSDLNNYSTMVKPGGYLVIDDCCCDMKMPFGYFQGIQEVQDAFDQWHKTGFEFVCNVVHLRVLRRVL